MSKKPNAGRPDVSRLGARPMTKAMSKTGPNQSSSLAIKGSSQDVDRATAVPYTCKPKRLKGLRESKHKSQRDLGVKNHVGDVRVAVLDWKHIYIWTIGR